MSTILVVEDDPDVLDNIVDTLDAAQYRVFPAGSGNEGLTLATQQLPDVIVCDINMPGRNGFEVLKELRADNSTRTIPLIFLTGLAERADQRLGMELGADDYITKPFTQNELLIAIETQLQKRKNVFEKYEVTLQLLRKSIIYALPHEIRTPLFQIEGFADLLVNDADTITADQIRERASVVLSAGQRLSRMLENYLVYAQLELAHTDAKSRIAYNNHIIRKPAEIIQRQALQKACEYDREDDLTLDLQNMAIRIASDNLQKICEELVDNAFKFSLPGSKVMVSSRGMPGKYSIAIRDYGRGMTPDQINSIGAYMQFERALYEQQGLGLGFAIAKRLTDLHEGIMEIQSSLNQGTLILLQFQG